MSAAPKFTPGPWRYKPGSAYAHVVGGNPEIGIADCAQERPDSAEWHANARLIAAAPELYEAVRVCVDVLVRCDAEQRPNDQPVCTDDEWDAALEQGRAALAKVGA